MTPGAPVPAVCPPPTIVMHDGAALVRERRGRSAALRDPRGRQEARGALGRIDDRALRLARRPAQRPVRAGPSTTDPVTPLRNSGVWKVRLVVDGEPQEDLLVVRALPRLL